MNFNIIRDMIICTTATVFFSILFKVPRKAILLGSILGGIGYAVYEWTTPILQSPIAGYFIGTLLMAVCSEVLARIIKMPATIFTIPAIIPLVPGLGLYNTMLYLVQGKDTLAAKTGIDTILDITAMAMALVVTSILTKSISDTVKKAKSHSKF